MSADPTGDAPPPATGTPRRVRHGRALLAVHALREATGDGELPGSTRPLLCLHGLGERTPDTVPALAASWPGPVLGLDFTGHGDSSVAPGGGYTAETLMADVDAALGAIGPATLLGRGLGAYVALLAAGGRPELVRGAVLGDGPGLVGGGQRPGSPSIPMLAQHPVRTPDPMALLELARDVRPPDYAVDFVRLAVQWSGLATPLAVCAVVRPEWLASVVDQPGVLVTDAADALARFAALA